MGPLEAVSHGAGFYRLDVDDKAWKFRDFAACVVAREMQALGL